MASSISQSNCSCYFPSTQDIKLSISSAVEKTTSAAHKALTSLYSSVSMGARVGLAACAVTIGLEVVLSNIPVIAESMVDPELAAEYLEDVMGDFWHVAVEAPVLEEVVFRVMIQDFFKKVAAHICPDMDVEIFSHKFKLDVLVGVIATSALFGFGHLGSGFGLIHVIITTIAGITLGLLKEKYGLSAAITAHMTNNTIVYGLTYAFGV